MTDLSLPHRDPALDPAMASPCAGCTKAEAEIRALLGYISTSFLNDPSKFLGFELPKSEPLDCSELFLRWMQNFNSDPKFPWCPDLRKRIEALVFRLLTERVSAGSQDRCQKRKADEGERQMLALLKRVAVDPCDRELVDRQWKLKVLGIRKRIFLRLADVANAKDFPYLVGDTATPDSASGVIGVLGHGDGATVDPAGYCAGAPEGRGYCDLDSDDHVSVHTEESDRESWHPGKLHSGDEGTSKRNKRHPDIPFRIKLRARKGGRQGRPFASHGGSDFLYSDGD